MIEPVPLAHPPRASLTFRVGVVGHRPNRLPRDEADLQTLRRRISVVLESAKATVEAFGRSPDAAAYAGGSAQLRAVSPLAEGSDRMFAEVALDLGYSLCCPTPFPQAEFEQDFQAANALEPGSVERFRGLLQRAKQGPGLALFELNGDRQNEGAAYGAAGRVVLNQSDLLVAIWDGRPAAGAGGTVDTMTQAIGFRTPVLWIHTEAPFGWAFLRQPSDLDCLRAGSVCTPPGASTQPQDDEHLASLVAQIVLRELALPREPASAGAAHERSDPERQALAAHTYFGERKPDLNFGFIWKPFRDLFGSGRWTWPQFGVADFVEQIRNEWPTAADGADPAPSDATAWVNQRLRAHYAWADQLADFYADRHRSAFISAALLATLAVTLALLPMTAGFGPAGVGLDHLCIVGELVVVIFMLYLLGNRSLWHKRWMEYRVLAELIRQSRLLIPLGGGRPLPRLQPHLDAYGDPANSWMYWQMRAITRDVGLPTLVADQAYLAEALAYVTDITVGQLDFHRRTAKRCDCLHENLHSTAAALFYICVAGIALHLVVGLAFPGHEALGRWLSLLSAVAPALGAALASINNQGEFARLAKRSGSMAKILERFRLDLAALRQRLDAGQAAMVEVSDLSGLIAQAMIDENVEWRVVVLDLQHVSG